MAPGNKKRAQVDKALDSFMRLDEYEGQQFVSHVKLGGVGRKRSG